jgi:hypothetical protein
MRTEEFWAVVDRARGEGARGEGARGDGRVGSAEVARRAVAELTSRGADDALAWDRHLHKVLAASHLENLWAAAYLINGGCSDDGFDSFRGWLLTRGRDVFARAAREPDSLAELPEVRAAAHSGAEFQADDVLRIGAAAYEALTGAPPPAPPEPDAGRPSVLDFWDFDDEEEMQRRLPKLAALFLAPPEG